MGWTSGGEVFDAAADAMIRVGVESTQMTAVLVDLINVLRDKDWDGEDDSLYRLRDNPAVVEAFRKADPEWFKEYEQGQAEVAEYHAAQAAYAASGEDDPDDEEEEQGG